MNIDSGWDSLDEADKYNVIALTSNRKRRIKLSNEQQMVLEAIFAKQPFPDNSLRSRLATQLDLSTRFVQVWFQNRRVKQRKLSHFSNQASFPEVKWHTTSMGGGIGSSSTAALSFQTSFTPSGSSPSSSSFSRSSSFSCSSSSSPPRATQSVYPGEPIGVAQNGSLNDQSQDMKGQTSVSTVQPVNSFLHQQLSSSSLPFTESGSSGTFAPQQTQTQHHSSGWRHQTHFMTSDRHLGQTPQDEFSGQLESDPIYQNQWTQSDPANCQVPEQSSYHFSEPQPTNSNQYSNNNYQVSNSWHRQDIDGYSTSPSTPTPTSIVSSFNTVNDQTSGIPNQYHLTPVQQVAQQQNNPDYSSINDNTPFPSSTPKDDQTATKKHMNGTALNLFNNLIDNLLNNPVIIPDNHPFISNSDDKKKLEEKLLTASALGFLKHVVSILTSYPISIDVIDQDGNSPLMLSSSRGHIETVKYLVKKGANISQINRHGQNALNMSMSNGHWEISSLLMMNCSLSDLLCFDNQSKKDPLYCSVEAGMYQIVCQLLQRGVPTVPGSVSKSFRNSSPDIFSLTLLSSSSSSDPSNQNPSDTLYQRTNSFCGLSSGTSILTSSSPTLGLSNSSMMTPVAPFSKYPGGKSYLHLAVANAHINIIKMLLDFKCPVNLGDSTGKTPLMMACETGNQSIIKILLDKGASVHVKDLSGKSALDCASQSKKEKVIFQLLAKRGKKLS